jgi:ligand-binding SRPBCC domain-containing protein
MAREPLVFESRLSVAPAEAWRWMTSVEGVSAELAPVLKMTVPRTANTLISEDVALGQRLFYSWVLLFGFFPVDRMELTLSSIDVGGRFVEESPTLTMKQWRHERSLTPTEGGTVLTDRLTFEAKFGRPLVRWFIGRVFEHRHAVLRRRLGGGSSATARRA